MPRRFTQSHYRASMDRWYLQMLQPYGREWFSDGDLGNFAPGTEHLAVAHCFFPTDRQLDSVYQNTANLQKNLFGTDFFIEAMLITAIDPMRDAKGKLVDYKAGATLGAPKTYADDHRGVMIIRGAWESDALYLNFVLFAYHEGEKLPSSTWNAARTKSRCGGMTRQTRYCLRSLRWLNARPDYA